MSNIENKLTRAAGSLYKIRLRTVLQNLNLN